MSERFLGYAKGARRYISTLFKHSFVGNDHQLLLENCHRKHGARWLFICLDASNTG